MYLQKLKSQQHSSYSKAYERNRLKSKELREGR